MQLNKNGPTPRNSDACATFILLPAPTSYFAFERATADEKNWLRVLTNLSGQTRQFQRVASPVTR